MPQADWDESRKSFRPWDGAGGDTPNRVIGSSGGRVIGKPKSRRRGRLRSTKLVSWDEFAKSFSPWDEGGGVGPHRCNREGSETRSPLGLKRTPGSFTGIRGVVGMFRLLLVRKRGFGVAQHDRWWRRNGADMVVTVNFVAPYRPFLRLPIVTQPGDQRPSPLAPCVCGLNNINMWSGRVFRPTPQTWNLLQTQD